MQIISFNVYKKLFDNLIHTSYIAYDRDDMKNLEIENKIDVPLKAKDNSSIHSDVSSISSVVEIKGNNNMFFNNTCTQCYCSHCNFVTQRMVR